MKRRTMGDIVTDVDGHLRAIGGVPLRGKAAEFTMARAVAKALTFTRISPDSVPDKLEFLQKALDEMLSCLAVIIDRFIRADPLTCTYLALAYARDGIKDLVRHGDEPEAFWSWPRLWQAMLSFETRDEHGHGVHAGYVVDLSAIRAAESLLKELRGSPHFEAGLIARGCLSLLKRFRIPYRDVAWRAREHELRLVRSFDNPVELELGDSSVVLE